MKTIKELYKSLPYEIIGSDSFIIEGIEYDSRKAGPSSLFFCLRGARSDGHSFAHKAYENGCRAFAVEEFLPLPDDAIQVKTTNTRETLSLVSAEFYDHPADRLTVIGITGTKGKTTTAILIEKTLLECGIKCGYIGTNGVNIGSKHYKTVNSTPESLELNRFFNMMLEDGFTHVAIEVSSQALNNYRINGIKIDVAIYTNLSEDHIGPGEHPTFEDYRDAKKKLFTDYGAHTVIANADDPYAAYMTADSSGRVITLGITKEADIRASRLNSYRDSTSLGITFNMKYFGKDTEVKMRTPGEFSTYNGLSALAAVYACGVDMEDAVRAIKNVSVSGRFELAANENGVTYIIDYAHNGFSLESALSVLGKYEHNRLICLFGCIGGRTFLRRKELAETSARLADYTIISSDNPDNEEPETIIEDVLTYFDKTKPYISIVDREEAIRYAVNFAEPGDIVLFAGKGHEDYQIIKGERVPFSEKTIILDELSKKH